jgi:molybdopterin molybdotransferase
MSLPLPQARAAVFREVAPLVAALRRQEQVSLGDAAGRVLAADVLADRDQPPFDRSTRDGFAVRAADVAGASPERPAAVRRVGEVAAGSAFSGRVEGGACVEIMTGAPLPPGTDAVVMVEHTERAGEDIQVRRSVVAGENIVPRGSELRAGALACAAGATLDPATVGLLASLGVARPQVVARPRVAVLATGDELVPVESTPAAAQIRDSNRHTLAAQIARAGGLPLPQPIVRDDPGAIRSALAQAIAGADLLLVSGGVSMGKYDFVEGALAELGARVVFDGVDIRPGKPLVFGTIGAQRDGQGQEDVRRIPFFGLPGNPLSTLVTFELFVRPAIGLLLGRAESPALATTGARLAVDYAQRKLPLTVFVPAAFVPLPSDDPAAPATVPLCAVKPVPSQGSGDLRSMAAADALMIVEPGTTDLPAGSLVAVLPK